MDELGRHAYDHKAIVNQIRQLQNSAARLYTFATMLTDNRHRVQVSANTIRKIEDIRAMVSAVAWPIEESLSHSRYLPLPGARIQINPDLSPLDSSDDDDTKEM